MPRRQKYLKQQKSTQHQSTQQGLQGQVRIIGGDWRGRKLPVLNATGLRPTSDRVRETLFNWLQSEIPASRCLDVFAGSGALALESLSRGAAYTLLLEKDPPVAKHLRLLLEKLQPGERQPGAQATGAGEVCNADALQFLDQPATSRFDIVFLDPPFGQGLLEPTCQLLQAHQWLLPEARVYIEVEKRAADFALPDNWQCLKEKQAGEVRFALYQAFG